MFGLPWIELGLDGKDQGQSPREIEELPRERRPL